MISRFFFQSIFLSLLAFHVIFPQNFAKTGLSFPGFTSGNIVWGDYNNDGFLDILFAGGPYPWAGTSSIYKNNGDGTFSENQSSFILKLSNATGAWVDVNNDGLLDIIISGYYQLLRRPVAKVYLNNGDETFSETPNDIAGTYYSSIACADFDNNGTIDFVISGLDRDLLPLTKLYKNLGNGSFEAVQTGFVNVWQGSSAWGDFDNDGFLDLVISGNDNIDNNLSKGVTKLYRNNGDGSFTSVQSSVPGVFTGSVSWGDYNNDGLLDILITGDRKFELFGMNAAIAEIYKNTGGGTFQRADITLPGMISSTGIWADINNDGNIDILLSGSKGVFGIEPYTQLFINDGTGGFSPTDDSLKQLAQSVAALGDFNNNGRLDLILSGYDEENLTYSAVFYENITASTNARPLVPSGLSEAVTGSEVTLSWNSSTDPQNAGQSVTYNIRIGTAPGTADIYTPMASAVTGKRSIPHYGNVNHNTSWKVKGLAPGEYYWSVQAVDNGFLASAFSPERKFIIGTPASAKDVHSALSFELKGNYPNPFNPSTMISFSLPEDEFVSLKVYNILGNEAAVLAEKEMPAGSHRIEFSAGNLAAGVYIYILKAGRFSASGRMMLVK
ncbi:MAG: VCBS repeat-containing protein [Ignavibacteriales bacterium]|nr:MAG: VCBS repeat-containing protein [Ignavibacteriales bacterium]